MDVPTVRVWVPGALVSFRRFCAGRVLTVCSCLGQHRLRARSARLTLLRLPPGRACRSAPPRTVSSEHSRFHLSICLAHCPTAHTSEFESIQLIIDGGSGSVTTRLPVFSGIPTDARWDRYFGSYDSGYNDVLTAITSDSQAVARTSNPLVLWFTFFVRARVCLCVCWFVVVLFTFSSTFVRRCRLLHPLATTPPH